MSGFHALVLVPRETAEEDIEESVEKLIAPYSKWVEVAPYRKYLQQYEIDQVAWRNNIPPQDLEQVIAKLKEEEKDYDLDQQGIYYMTTRNPRGIWDGWRIGGSWDGIIQGRRRHDGRAGNNLGREHEQVRYNICVVSQLPKFLFITEIVTPDGIWHSWDMRGERGKGTLDKMEELTILLGQHPYDIAVAIECHF